MPKQLSPTPNPYPGVFLDFHGLPSNPKCIFRTGDPWPPFLREARPICVHPIQDSWFELSTQIYESLDFLNVQWSTIDPVRFAEEGGEAGPLHLWVGVEPGSLSFEDAQAAAEGCKKILTDAGFPGVEIAFRESIYTRSVGPQLLNYVPYRDPIAQNAAPFTPALGIRIAPLKAPHFEGTAALYLRENSQSERVFVLTARHVALPPPIHNNRLYTRSNSDSHASSKPAEKVILLGTQAYTKALIEMMGEIEFQSLSIDVYRNEIEALGDPTDGEDAKITSARRHWQNKVEKARQAITDINALHKKITEHWTKPEQRVVGYVRHAPPMSFGTGPEQFTEDWALIDLDVDKIDWGTFMGNVINLGSRIAPAEFWKKMHPDPNGRSSFKFPVGALLKVKGVVGEDDLCRPKQLDANGEPCLLVVKNGNTTNVTLGRGTGLESIVRTIDEYGVQMTSREFAIYPYSRKDGPFSAPGDSGSIVVDGNGRIVGLLTGGSGATDATDVTYITPYYWLEKRIKDVFPDSYLYPMKN
ncbi:hypothetical protein BS47DRAFT_1374340 [Hydnum rufescens UP504]|uniref:Uncharacterized protein n=1 Tax=Hydnum rufescens UP504 TaxID=1448309 RepID=A0A9P6AFP4_9AGAM|nr:hypothetical protein BS47DRAFT_1374340 [Hydnum rufescens UP504]